MPIPQQTYSDIIDAWLQRKRNGVVEPMPGDVTQQATDTLQRAASGRLGTVDNGLDPWAASAQHALDGTAPVYTPPTGLEIAPSDVTAQTGADIGALADLVAPKTTISNTQAARTGYVGMQPGVPTVTTTPSDSLEQVGRAIGGSIPSMATTAPLLASPAGLPFAVAKAYGEGYTPQADPVAGFINAAGMAVAPGAVNAGSSLAQAAAERFMLPSVAKIAAEGAPAAVEGLKTAIDPTTHAIMAGSRLAGGVAGGTAVAEGQRQATSLANTGELSAPTGTDMLMDLGLNLAFAAPLARSALGARGQPMSFDAAGNPVFSDQAAPLVAEVMNRSQQAQAMRNATAEKTTAYNNSRGQRISDAHQEIFQAAEDGTDPTEAIGRLKAHWDEAQQTTDPVHGLAVLKSMSDEGNDTGIPDDVFHKIVAAVQGKYADHFKNDPSLPGPERVNQMIKAGVMPAVTKEWISTNFADAVDMMLGDYEGAKSNMANRIFAYQMERLPGATEAMKAIDARAGTELETKTSMGQMTDSAKDAQYFESIFRVTPHLKNAVVSNGGVNEKGNSVDLPLLHALYKRDETVSSPMFDTSGPFQTGKKAKYDAWRDAVIQVANTYNPVTRQGMYQMSANKPPIPVSFEDMVAMKDGKYTFKPRVIREMDRPGASEAVRDAIDFVDNIQQRQSPDDELSLENQQDLISGKPQHLAADKGLQRTPILEATDAELTADAHDQGVDPKHLDKYIGDMRDFEQPGLGLNEQSPATLYDVGLHLMSKVSKGDSKEMYKKYGEKYFGSQDPETKKPELFKSWLLARLESEIGQQGTTKSVTGAERQDVHQISKAQADFYQQWREVANAKRLRDGKEPIPLPTTWGEKREQYRHALRLYAGTRGNIDMKQLFIDLLDDNKTYQNFLKRAKGEKVEKSQAQIPFFDIGSRYFTNSVQEDRRAGYRLKFKNPVATVDGGRISGFTNATQRALYGYDKNGNEFSIYPQDLQRATGGLVLREGRSFETGKKLQQAIDDVLKNFSDKKEYDRLQEAMSTLGFDKVSTPEFQSLWKQSEAIKNRNGGMPPGTKAADEKATYNKNWGRHWPHGMWLDPQGKIIPNDTGHMETGIDILGSQVPKNSRGDYDDSEFDEIFGGMQKKGYVQLRGEDGELRVISKGLTRTQKAALERYGIEHESKVTDVTSGRMEVIYAPPTDSKATAAGGRTFDVTHDYSGFTTPVFDALRVGESFGKRIGLDEGSAKELGALTSKFVQAFPEFAGFGETKTNEAGIMGLHVRNSEDLQGPVALVNLDTIDQRQRGPLQKLASYLMTVGHELSHIASIPTGMAGAYRQQRVDNKDLVKGMFTEIGFDGTVDLLNAIQEVVLPPQFRPKTLPSIADQGSGFEEEAFSRLMEYTMLGVMTKDNPWSGKAGKKTDSWGEATKFLPDEVQAAMHLAFRDLTNVAGAVEQYFRSRPQQPKDKFIANTFSVMADYANKFVNVNSVKLAQYRAIIDRQRAMFAAAGSVDLEDPVMVRTVLDVDEDAMHDVTGTHGSIADDTREAVEMAQVAMMGSSKPNKLTLAHERALGTRVPPWSHWMSLSYQTMLRFHKEGNPLAETVMYKLNDLEKAYFRLNRTMHDPFMIVDKGRLKYDPEHPLLRILQRSDPAAVRARVVLSDLARWANEVGKPVMKDGQLSNEIPAGLFQKLTSFKPEDQQGILKGMESLLKGTQEAATVLFNDRVESSAARLGAIMMTVDRTMLSDKVFAQGKQIVETSVVLNNAKAALQQAQKDQTLAAELPAAQQRYAQSLQAFNQSMAGLQGEQMAAVQTYLFGKDGIATELSALDEFFKKRADWFTTESRPGRYFIQSHLPGPDGGAHYTSAPNLREAKAVQKRLAEAGHTGILATDRQHPTSDNMMDAPDSVVQSYMNKESAAWKSVRDALEAHLSPEDLKFIDELGYVPGGEVQKGMENKGIKRYMQERELTSGREELDMIDAFTNYTGRLSGSVARRGLTRELGLLMQDPRLRNEGDFKETVKTMQNTLLQPLNNGLQTVRAGLTARYLGLPNFVGPMIEMMQSPQGILPYFIQNVGFVKGTKTFTDSLVAPARIKMERGSLEYRRTLESAKQKELVDPKTMTKKESTLLYYDRQQSEGGFKQGPIYASGFSRNHQMVEQAAFGLGASKPKPIESMISDPLYWAAQMSMAVYSTASDYNTRIAFLGALDMLYDRGLRGQELYQGAAAYQNLYTHGGGKANTVGYVNKLSNPLTRSAWGLTETMQRYMFGNTTMQKDMFDEMLGRVEGATPRQRKNAASAFATAQFVQLLLAGAMGLTGVGIASTVIQKATGYDPKQKLREFWKDLTERMGADEPTAVMLANYAQNGFVSNTLGVDVSNRVTMNSFLGFNEYDGFNTNELTGVVSSTIQDLWDATKYVAQGEMTKAGRSMVSPSMRPYVDLYASQRDYGDNALRDQSGNMITQQTTPEAVKSAIGLKPYRYRLLKDAKLAQMNSDAAFKMTQGQQNDDLSQELLRGNTQAVFDHVASLRAKDPTISPQSIVGPILDSAVNATRPGDPLSTGPVQNAERQKQIAASFGEIEPRQSELQDLMTKTRLNAQVGFMGGLPPTKQAIDRAAVVDALVQNRGLTKAEASRMATLLGY